MRWRGKEPRRGTTDLDEMAEDPRSGRTLACPKCGRSFPALDRQSLDHFRQTIAKKAMAKFGVEL